MSLVTRLSCVMRGGHRWETMSDSAGSITTCGRCGKAARAGTSPLKPTRERGIEDDGRYGDSGHPGG